MSYKIKVNIARITLFFIIGFLFAITLESEARDDIYNIEKVAFLYEGNQLIGVNVDSNAVELIDTYKQKQSEYSQSGKMKVNLNTSVYAVPSIIKFTVDQEKQQSAIDYARDNTNLLDDGYTVSIDNQHKFYIKNKEDLDWTVDQILLAYLPDESYLDYYKNTGRFKSYEDDGKTYTEIDLASTVTISEGYVVGSKEINNREDLLFELFHDNQTKSYNIISNTNNIGEIKERYELTETEFKLNNPSLSENSITYDGQQIVVNKLSPIVDVAITYETKEIKELEYETVIEYDDNLDKGQFNIDTDGELGETTITYENVVVNDEIISTTKSNEEVTKKPVHRIITVGPGTVISTNIIEDYEPSQEKSSGFIWPSSSRRVTCEYGCYPNHVGIDIASYSGGPIYAAQSGMVVTSGWSRGGYGYYVEIDHGNGFRTIYAHQRQQPPVEVGQFVEQGQVIGFEGTTGNSTGVHLHFEIKVNGSAVNPRGYI